MPQTLATMERKASHPLMGAGGSTAGQLALDVPFPINAAMNNKLDFLSMVVGHILNTSDIYDLNNLARPGVCGDYAVLLKDQIEKRLIPFTSDISGSLESVVYQNPTRMIKSESKRKVICEQIADTAIRVAAIVVASLASIQVASESRETIAAAVPVQKGGSLNEVRSWLRDYNYIAKADEAAAFGQTIEIHDPNNLVTNNKYFITFMKTDGDVTYANLSVRGDGMPTGSLKLQFLNPITIPGTTKKILPVRILDNTGIPWMVGVLCDNIYKSLGSPDRTYAFEVWNNLFIKSRPGSDPRNKIPLYESDMAELARSNAIFEQVIQTKQSSLIINQIYDFLLRNAQSLGITAMSAISAPTVPGLPNPYAPNPYAANPYAPNPYVPNPYVPNPYAPRPLPVPGYGLPGYGLPGYGFPGQPMPKYGQGLLNNQFQYTIPDQYATRNILTKIAEFKSMYVKKSCPASVRAHTLSGQVNSNRTIRTGVCNDPYWKETTLAKIYPFAALQFLCINNWKNVGIGRIPETAFSTEWITFVKELGAMYDTNLIGKGPSLEELAFKVKIPVCDSQSPGSQGSPDVEFKLVQAGLQQINAEFENHVKEIWKILGDLIEVVQDPGTKTELVRLVSAATKTGSKAYVEGVAKRAQRQIIRHYMAVEQIYFSTAKALRRV